MAVSQCRFFPPIFPTVFLTVGTLQESNCDWPKRLRALHTQLRTVYPISPEITRRKCEHDCLREKPAAQTLNCVRRKFPMRVVCDSSNSPATRLRRIHERTGAVSLSRSNSAATVDKGRTTDEVAQLCPLLPSLCSADRNFRGVRTAICSSVSGIIDFATSSRNSDEDGAASVAADNFKCRYRSGSMANVRNKLLSKKQPFICQQAC